MHGSLTEIGPGMTRSSPLRDVDGFRVQIAREGGVAHLLLSGELDMATVPVLDDHLARAEADDPLSILIDLALVTFMDSCGLQTLIRAAERADARGRRLDIVNCPGPVRRVFELTGMDGLLDGGSSR